MQGSIIERIKYNTIDSQGKRRNKVKVYDVHYRYKDPVTGRMKPTVKRGFLTKKAAQDFLLEVNEQLATNTYLKPKVILFKDYLQTWLETYAKVNLRPNTYSGYKRIVESHLIPHLGGLDIKEITAIHIDKLYSYLLQYGRVDGKGGLSAKSVQYTHRVLSEALEHAIRKQLIYRNPIKSITNIPRPKKFQANIYTAEEILHLLELVKDTGFEVPVALAAVCGLRRGECLAITMDDVDFANKIIRINKQLLIIDGRVTVSDPKSENSNRIVSAPAEVFDIIQRRIRWNEANRELLQQEYNDHGLVICQANGEFINPVLFSKNFGRFIKRNKLKKIRFHDLRHSCASLMLQSGVAMKTASQILGHSSISITADLYTHLLESTKKEAARQVGDTLFGNPGKNNDSPHRE